MERNIKPIIEAIIFSSEEPVTPEKLLKVFPSFTRQQLINVLEELKEEYEKSSLRGFYIRKVKKGYQFRTKPIFAEWITRYHQVKPQRLSSSGLEVLAIIAYRQPVTKPEIEDIRKVDSTGALKTLIEKGLIKTAGRKDIPGRPLIYVTTGKFLEVFGLNSLEDLPKIDEEIKKEQEEAESQILDLFNNSPEEKH